MTDWRLADYWWLLILSTTALTVIALIVVADYWRLPMITIYDWLMTCWLLMTRDIDHHCYRYPHAHYCCWLLSAPMVAIYDWLMTCWLVMTWCWLSLLWLWVCLLLQLTTDDSWWWLYMTDWWLADYWRLLVLFIVAITSSCLVLLLIADDCRRLINMIDWRLADYWWPLILIIVVMISIVLIIVDDCWRLPMITLYDWLMIYWLLMTMDNDYHCYDYHYAYCRCWLLTIADDHYTWPTDDLLIIDDYWY